jgi:hypothetical protein
MSSFEDAARKFLESCKAEFDEVTTKKSEITKDDDYSFTLSTPDHLQFAKYGRGPGKKPPLKNIIEFVKAEDIQFEGTTKEGTAFAIQNSIGKKGTLNWVQGAPDFLTEVIDKHKKEFNEGVEAAMAVETTNAYNEGMKESLEKQAELFKEFKI